MLHFLTFRAKKQAAAIRSCRFARFFDQMKREMVVRRPLRQGNVALLRNFIDRTAGGDS